MQKTIVKRKKWMDWDTERLCIRTECYCYYDVPKDVSFAMTQNPYECELDSDLNHWSPKGGEDQMKYIQFRHPDGTMHRIERTGMDVMYKQREWESAELTFDDHDPPEGWSKHVEEMSLSDSDWLEGKKKQRKKRRKEEKKREQVQLQEQMPVLGALDPLEGGLSHCPNCTQRAVSMGPPKESGKRRAVCAMCQYTFKVVPPAPVIVRS